MTANTNIYRKVDLTSGEEPSDEMLEALMEQVAQAARASSARAEEELQRRFQAVNEEIKKGRQ